MNTIVEEWLQLLSSDQFEQFEERSALIEFDGGLPRDHAECLALLIILKSNPLVLTGKQREKEDHI